MTEKPKNVFDGNVRKIGGSTHWLVPKIVCEYLEIDEDTPIQWCQDVGKHGKYIGIWNPKQQKKR